MNKDIEVNYKNKKRYKTSKYPIRQPIYLTWLIYVLSKIMTFGMKIKVDKVNMEGLKPPYMIFSNHMSSPVLSIATRTYHIFISK